MNMNEVKKRAADLGLSPRTRKKTDVIRTIQNAEGNPPCYATGRNDCDQSGCCWRDDCLPKSRPESDRGR